MGYAVCALTDIAEIAVDHAVQRGQGISSRSREKNFDKWRDHSGGREGG